MIRPTPLATRHTVTPRRTQHATRHKPLATRHAPHATPHLIFYGQWLLKSSKVTDKITEITCMITSTFSRKKSSPINSKAFRCRFRTRRHSFSVTAFWMINPEKLATRREKPGSLVSSQRRRNLRHTPNTTVTRSDKPHATRHTPLATQHTVTPDAARHTPHATLPGCHSDTRPVQPRATRHAPHATPHATLRNGCV